MNQVNRNMVDYVQQYRELPFEPIQIEYRRKLVLQKVNQLSPRRLLEVGCGAHPLFVDLPSDMAVTVVEPAQAFAENALKLSEGRSNVQVVQGFIESVGLKASEFDMIILSCVLHEVPDPSALLNAIKSHCSPTTLLHVNVPNANSLHRLLAVAMGLIPCSSQQSDTQKLMQQRETIYDLNSLSTELSLSGFRVVEQGSLFVKPFTHSQMQELVDNGFMNIAMLDGLDRLVDLLPELGSEIWINARRIN